MRYYLSTIRALEVEVKDSILDSLEDLHYISNELISDYDIRDIEGYFILPLYYYSEREYSEILPYNRDECIALMDILDEDLRVAQTL